MTRARTGRQHNQFMHRFVFISTMEGNAWGGSEELWSQAAVRLAADGHRVSAYTGPRSGASEKVGELRRSGVEVEERPVNRLSRWDRLLRRTRARNREGRGASRAAKWLSERKPDLVCISQGGITDGMVWAQHCREAGHPYVLIAQSNAEWLWPNDDRAEQLAALYGAARRCCFVARRNLELFQDQIGCEITNAVVIGNPFKVCYETRIPWPRESSEWRLACVARIEPLAKGQDLLLRVLSMEKWRKRNLRVAFFGRGRCEGGVRRLADRLGLGAVEFQGQVENVEGIWRENHALVLPSRYEGTPLALVEAMLCSRPAIVTDVAGNAELVEHGVSGFVARAAAMECLDAAMEAAWERRSKWEKMGFAARQRVTAIVSRDPVGDFCRDVMLRAAGGA